MIFTPSSIILILSQLKLKLMIVSKNARAGGVDGGEWTVAARQLTGSAGTYKYRSNLTGRVRESELSDRL